MYTKQEKLKMGLLLVVPVRSYSYRYFFFIWRSFFVFIWCAKVWRKKKNFINAHLILFGSKEFLLPHPV